MTRKRRAKRMLGGGVNFTEKWGKNWATIQIYTSYISRIASPLRVRDAVSLLRDSVNASFFERYFAARINALSHEIHAAHFDGRDFRAAALCLLRAWFHIRLGAWIFFRW